MRGYFLHLFFSQVQPDKRYSDLLMICSKMLLFCVFSLCRFHGISTKLEEVKNIEEIKMLIDELKREMAMLSVRN